MGRDERGSASLVLVVAMAFGAILAAFAADLARVAAVRARAQAAADAAALAAAQELVIPTRHPAEAASEYAGSNGARLSECRCEPTGDEVVVTVEATAHLDFLGGERTLRATARAVVGPG